MGNLRITGSSLYQYYQQGESASSKALLSSPQNQQEHKSFLQEAGSAQGAQNQESNLRSLVQQLFQSIGMEVEDLQQQLSTTVNGSAHASGPNGPSNNINGEPAPASGQNIDIDGGNVSGHGVVEQVDNNTGAAARFGWENAQGKVVGELDLQNGQKGTFKVNADGADGKSARLIKLNTDGSIPAQSNLDEQNVATNPNGSPQVSVDVSEITAGSDPTKIRITDGKRKSIGNGAPGGAYLYPTQDQITDPNQNPNTGAMDPSGFYDNNFTN